MKQLDDYKILVNDDLVQLEGQINEALSNGYMFMGDLKREGNLWIREMVKPVPMKPVQIPVPKAQKGEK